MMQSLTDSRRRTPISKKSSVMASTLSNSHNIMDWKALTAKAQPWIDKTKPWLDKTKPLVAKAKSYGSSAVSMIAEQIETTPIFLTTEESYNIHMSSKRAIIIAYDNRDAVSESIRIMMPVWATQAWTDAAELRYIETSGNADLARNLNIVGPLEMRISYMGDEYARLHTLDDIRAWWKARCYKKDTPVDASEAGATNSIDPLA
jgi:hypothetical protein